MAALPEGEEALLHFAFGDGLGHSRDEDGRFLGEHTAPGYAATRDEGALVFHDRRDQAALPANLGALRQVNAHWSFVLALLGAPSRDEGLRGSIRRQLRPRALLCLNFLHGYAHSSAHAAAYKASIGFGQLLRFWTLDDATAGRVAAALPDERALLALLDAEGWLVGASHVCPGSRRAIAEAWRVLLGDDPRNYGASDDDMAHAAELSARCTSMIDALLDAECAMIFAEQLETPRRPREAFAVALQYLAYIDPTQERILAHAASDRVQQMHTTCPSAYQWRRFAARRLRMALKDADCAEVLR